MRRRGGAIFAVVLLALAGCNRGAGDTVDDAALQAIGDSVAASLNEPGAAIVQLLKSVNRPTPIAAETLQITLDQKAAPIDWWLVRNSYVQVISPPPAPDRPTFLVAPAATSLIEQGAVWFTAGAGTPSQVDCHSTDPSAAGGCVVDVEVTPSFTEAGAALAGANPLPNIKVHAVVATGGDGWKVRELRVEGASLHDYAINALMGNEAARAAARQQLMSTISNSGALTAAPNQDAASAFQDAASASPTPQFAPPPVAPVIGETPYTPKRQPPPRVP